MSNQRILQAFMALLFISFSIQQVDAAEIRATPITTTLVVKRFENGGIMNIHSSLIAVSKNGKVVAQSWLSGGQEFLVKLKPGTYSVVVFSAPVYQRPLTEKWPPEDQKECSSLPYKIELALGDSLVLNVWPTSKDGGYDPCGWEILPQGKSQKDNCLQPHPPPECKELQ